MAHRTTAAAPGHARSSADAADPEIVAGSVSQILVPPNLPDLPGSLAVTGVAVLDVALRERLAGDPPDGLRQGRTLRDRVPAQAADLGRNEFHELRFDHRKSIRRNRLVGIDIPSGRFLNGLWRAPEPFEKPSNPLGTIMTTPLINRPAPWWLRELAHGRAAYEEMLGWPVSVQVGDRVLIVAIGSSIAAMTMPAALGAAVRDELCLVMQDGPVLTDPDGLKWTFLTRPAECLRPGVATELAKAQVRLAPRGGHVVVPTAPAHRPTPAGQAWRWIVPPHPVRPLPPAYPAIAVTRRLTERTGRLAA